MVVTLPLCKSCTSDPARPWFRSCPDDPGQAPQPKALLLVRYLPCVFVRTEKKRKKKKAVGKASSR